MQHTKTENIPCRVNRIYDGLMRLYTHEVQPAEDAPVCTFWYGVLDVACSQEEAQKQLCIPGADLLIKFEDNRAGLVRVLAAQSTEEFNLTLADSIGANEGSQTLIYVVGLTHLVPLEAALAI